MPAAITFGLPVAGRHAQDDDAKKDDEQDDREEKLDDFHKYLYQNNLAFAAVLT
jgi:hypothetical protein